MLISSSFSFPQRHPHCRPLLPGRALRGERGTGASLVTVLRGPRTLRDTGAGGYPRSAASLRAGKPGAVPAPTCRQLQPAALEEPLPLLRTAVIEIKPSCPAAGGPPSPTSQCPEPRTAVTY